uniref:Uncharacterized protein n=1 Tax=Timema poppense TaxID=170557 RepID=A0A7R9CPN4_TIMPO|nr:unnamed protein product [Timema poppensis]
MALSYNLYHGGTKKVTTFPTVDWMYSSPVASLVLIDSSQLTSDSQHLEFDLRDVSHGGHDLFDLDLLPPSSPVVITAGTRALLIREEWEEIQDSMKEDMITRTGTDETHREIGKLLYNKNTLSTLDWDANPGIQVIDSLAYFKSEAIDHSIT